MANSVKITAVEEAVSHVAYALSDLSYVIKPVSFGAALKEYIVSARRNVFDQVGKVEISHFSQELIERAYEASKSGQFITLFAPSPSALLQMVPTMYKLSNALLPAVIHVIAREHSDIMAVRQTGFVILYSLNASETIDMSLVAHVASLRVNVPVLHVFDGDMAYNELENRVGDSMKKFSHSLVPYSRLAALIGLDPSTSTMEYRQLVLARSTIQSHSSETELYFQKSKECISRFQSVPSMVEELFSHIYSTKGYQLFEYLGHPEAESIVVVMGTASCVLRQVVESLYINWQAKVGVVSVRLYRPWCTTSFLRAVPTTAQRVAVLDRMNDINNAGEPLYMDVLSTFGGEEGMSRSHPSILGGKYAVGINGLDLLKARVVVEALAAGTLTNGFLVQSEVETTPDISPMPSTLATPSYETPYIKMLLQLFGKRAVIANLAHATTIWEDAPIPTDDLVIESGEFGFGVHLGIVARKRHLHNQVNSLLSSPSISSISERLSHCLQSWINPTTTRSHQEAISQEILILLEHETQPELIPLITLKHYFAPLSQWIVGSHELSRDLRVSGIHQILQSGENVNILILDTESMHAVDTTQRKRDVGLYAMQYGNAYVASVALYDSYAQVLRALNEADAFDGPSIVLCFAPNVQDIEQETKEAVSSGYWPLYRYNPQLEGVSDEKAFALESPSIKQELLTFLQRHHQLSVFAQQALAPSCVSVSQHYEQIGHQALEASYQALLHGIGTTTCKAPWQIDTKLTIVVGSDNGHAEDFASKFLAEALGFGLENVIKMDMNAYEFDKIEEDAQNAHAFTLFVCSTAGQGEFPSNAKEFWHRLSTFSSTLSLQYGVFGLGDSHYWPREEEKHYFCKAPVDLDAKLGGLGAKRCVAIAKADDQDIDGPLTQYEAWKSMWWKAIGIPNEVLATLPSTKIIIRNNEDIKRESNYLRGGLAIGLEDRTTKQLPADDTQLTKFHGIYQQDNRDMREEMRLTNQEKAFSFMIRVRVPGGVSTAAQYLMIDQLSDSHANGNIKLTTRQAYQLQGILKWNLKPIVQGINRVLMDSLAACGDVNRNVMLSVNPPCSINLHQEIVKIACSLSSHLSPKTSAYHEIWLDKKMVAGGEIKDVEPIYGETYLPRKFKIAIAIPPSNDVDVFANCLGLIAIIDRANDLLIGFNVTVGGGMGMTHNNHKTFPRLGDVLAFITPDQVNNVCEQIVIQQRDLGDRVNRKHARYKYTVEDHGLVWIQKDLEQRLGYSLAPPRPFTFTHTGDRFGWNQHSNGLYSYTMFIEGGRIKDTETQQLRSGLRAIAQEFSHVEFHLTPNQNLSLVGILEDERMLIKTLMATHHIGNDQYTGLRLNSIACAALPFCGLAFAEAERYLPTLITKLETIIEENGLRDDAIVIRMTGCANGCGRPYLGEIGLVGRSPGIYNLYLGAGHAGERLNKLYQEGVDEEQILNALAPIIQAYASYRQEKETFGDFVIRYGYVQECLAAPLVENRAPAGTFHS